MPRRASSILKALCSYPRASRSRSSAARAKAGLVGALAAQRRFRRVVAPRLMRDAAERQPRFLDRAAFEFQRGRDRDQREGIGQPVADFQVGVVAGKTRRRQFDRGDDFVRLQVGVDLRRVARQAVEIAERNHALAGGTGDAHLGIERGERHAHVGRMRGDAVFAGAEDGVNAVDAADRRAARAGLALVAGRHGVIEIGAARTLHQIAAGRSHVAQLLRGAGQYRACDQRVTLLDQRVIGEVGVRHQRADAQAAVGGRFDGLERQPRDVDQPGRALDIAPSSGRPGWCRPR